MVSITRVTFWLACSDLDPVVSVGCAGRQRVGGLVDQEAVGFDQVVGEAPPAAGRTVIEVPPASRTHACPSCLSAIDSTTASCVAKTAEYTQGRDRLLGGLRTDGSLLTVRDSTHLSGDFACNRG